MKNWIKSIFAVLCGVMIATTFVACGGDDDDNGANVPVTAEQLIGKWINTKVVWNDSREPQPEEYTYNSNRRYLQLNADGTGMVTPYDLFEVEIKGTFTWKLIKNVLSISESNGDVENFIVTGISPTSLELTWYENEDGITIREVSSFVKTAE